MFPTALAVRDHNQALVKRYKTDVQNAVLCDAFNFVQQPLMASDHDTLHSDFFRLFFFNACASSSMHASLRSSTSLQAALLASASIASTIVSSHAGSQVLCCKQHYALLLLCGHQSFLLLLCKQRCLLLLLCNQQSFLLLLCMQCGFPACRVN